MHAQRGIQVIPADADRVHMCGDDLALRLAGMRLSIPHPDKPDEIILFGPEDVTILFHPDFWPQAPSAPPAHP